MKHALLVGLACCLPVSILAGTFSLHSPAGNLELRVSQDDAGLSYLLRAGDRLLVDRSAVGWEGTGESRVTSHTERTIDETWKPVYGKRSELVNHCRELTLEIAGGDPALAGLHLVFRVYDGGIAFRWMLDGQGTYTLPGEQAAFRFSGDPQWWSYRREQAPAGPFLASVAKGAVGYPVVSSDVAGYAVALTEAHLRDMPWAEFTSLRGAAGWALVPRKVNVTLPFQTPWRVIMVGDTPGALIDSDLVANLNPHSEPGAFDWIRPGVSFWDWRAWGHQAPDGFTYGLDLASWKRFIDFASETGVPYLLLDANWYGNEFSKDSNPFSGGNARAVKQAIAYGRERGVGLVLYLNHVAAVRYGFEDIIKAYADWGAAGIKYGFMRIKTPAEKVKWTHHVVEECKRNKLFVNFHDGPVPPTGEEVTWPNFVHREFCHAQSDAKRVFSPSDFIKMAHVNMLAGPLDMNNGLFDLNHSHAQRPKIFTELYSTITAEAARTLITYGGGMTVIPDSADSYRAHRDLFGFIAAQRMPWRESRTLSSALPDHLSMMRQAADGVFLVGTVTNEEAREIVIPLTFLEPGQVYEAVIFSDTEETHFRTNREAYRVKRTTVKAFDTVTARLAPGGGHCMILRRR